MKEEDPTNNSASTDKAAILVPADFPRDPFPAALPGTQVKFSARKIDGRYVVGSTADELQERYEMCMDLATQLVARTRRKVDEGVVPSIDAFYVDTEHRIRAQSARDNWDFSEPELEWIFTRMRANEV